MHEPECPIQGDRTAQYFACICPELRAAELRGFHRGYSSGVEWYKSVALSYGKRKWNEALWWAERAVDALPAEITTNPSARERAVYRSTALDAIKDLRV